MSWGYVFILLAGLLLGLSAGVLIMILVLARTESDRRGH